MASISEKGSKGNHTFTLEVTEVSQSTTANTTTLKYALQIQASHSSFRWENQGTSVAYSVTIAGENVASGYYPNYDGTTKTIVSGTTTVAHEVGGAKSITIAFEITDRDEDVTCGDASASTTMTLTKISVASYTLSISKGTGTIITVNRTSSPKGGGETGNLSNGAKVYYSDVLKITFGAESGYEIDTHTVNGTAFTSESNHTVTSNVTVIATAKMLGAVYIDNGTTVEKYLVFIDTGTGWLQYVPYIDDGSKWQMCS